VPRVGAPEVAPDGRSLAVAVSTPDLEANAQRGRLWLLDGHGEREPRPLTSTEHNASRPRWSPDGTRLAYLRKGTEPGAKAQVFLLSLAGGEAERLTDLPLGVTDLTWLPDGSGLVVVAQLLTGHVTAAATTTELERRQKDPVKAHVTEERFFRYWDTWLTTGEVMHLFHLDLTTRALRDLIPDSRLWFDWMDPTGQLDVSPDGEEIAFEATWFDERRSRVRSSVHLVALTGGTPRNVTLDHPSGAGRPRYAADGRTIVYGMSHDPDFYADRIRLMRYDRAGGTHTPILDGWDRSPVDWVLEPDGSLLLCAENEGRQALYRLAPGATAPTALVTTGWVSGPARLADGRLVLTHQTLTAPPEVARCAKDGSRLTRLSSFAAPALEGVALGAVEEIHFEGSHGERVQMFVIHPPTDAKDGKRPLVQVVHGGPHGVSGDAFGFRWNAHLFAAPGYVVAMVNFQGSTGWGQDFAQRIQGAWGERPLEDVLKGTDAMVATGLVDERRMALAGGSYGGYMAAWVAAHSDRFRCIVNHAGVYDTLAHWSCDVTQGRHKAFGGLPWDGIEAIDRWNPARFARGMVTPMLVIHGEKDYRVPETQGLACYNVLKAKGVPARLLYYPDEGHWILKPQNSLLWYREVHAWFARYLV
jgi:dipeptidyl aminopeptidase/acylaminoacyl peptidase